MSRQAGLFNALARQDGLAYARLCLEEGISKDGENPDLFLLEKGLADLNFTPCRLPEEILHPTSKSASGLIKADLAVLDYNTLARIFRGVNNLRVPNEMASVLNPDELVSKYSAVSYLKRKNKHLSSPHTFIDVIKEMDRTSFPLLVSMTRRTHERNFPAKHGMQIERLEALDRRVKDDFMSSFMKPYRYSSSQRRSGFDYVDPNEDGNSRKVYVNHIFDILSRR